MSIFPPAPECVCGVGTPTENWRATQGLPLLTMKCKKCGRTIVLVTKRRSGIEVKAWMAQADASAKRAPKEQVDARLNVPQFKGKAEAEYIVALERADAENARLRSELRRLQDESDQLAPRYVYVVVGLDHDGATCTAVARSAWFKDRDAESEADHLMDGSMVTALQIQ